MSKLDQPSRSKLVAWLAGFVVVFAAVSWFVTGGMPLQGAPLPLAHNHPATFPLPGTTPVVYCPSHQLKVVGIYDECATAEAKSSTCGVYGHMLDQVLRFTGNHQAFTLELQIDGAYDGPGTYELAPSRPLGTSSGGTKGRHVCDGRILAIDRRSSNRYRQRWAVGNRECLAPDLQWHRYCPGSDDQRYWAVELPLTDARVRLEIGEPAVDIAR